MSAHRLHNSVYAAFEAIAAAEKITRVKLAELSRDLLVYVPETDDIDIVNRLLGVLTPMNRETAIMFFSYFLPWDVEHDKEGTFQRFGKRTKGERSVKKKLDEISVHLKDEKFSIWTWAKDNVKIDKKRDFKGTIKRAIHNALDGDEKTDTAALSINEIFDAILDGGLTLDEMLQAASGKINAMKEVQDKMNAIEGTFTETPADEGKPSDEEQAQAA